MLRRMEHECCILWASDRSGTWEDLWQEPLSETVAGEKKDQLMMPRGFISALRILLSESTTTGGQYAAHEANGASCRAS